MRFAILDRIDHLVLNVKDVESHRRLDTQRVLGMEREEFGPKHHARAEIRRAEDPAVRPADSDSGKLGDQRQRPGRLRRSVLYRRAPPDVVVVGHLHECGVAILEGPVTREGAHSARCNRSICRDPEGGNLIEVFLVHHAVAMVAAPT